MPDPKFRHLADFIRASGIRLDGRPDSPYEHGIWRAAAGVGIALPMDPAAAQEIIQEILTVAQGGIAAGAVEDWHEIGAASEPGFQNSWANYGGDHVTAAFRKVLGRIVHVKGFVKNGSLGVPMFTLPVGYRPAQRRMYMGPNPAIASAAGGDSGRFDVYGTNSANPGEIMYHAGSNAWVSIECIFLI